MEIVLYGVRGTKPTPGADYVKYGGNTSCILVRKDGTELIIDAGTGIYNLGVDLINSAGGLEAYLKQPKKTCNVFLTHEHMDHIGGFPHFRPAYFDSVTINIHGAVKVEKIGIKHAYVGPEDALSRIQSGVIYPVALNKSYRSADNAPFMTANMKFHAIVPAREIIIDNLIVTPFKLFHPGEATGYKITDKITRDSVAIVFDTEYVSGQIYQDIIAAIQGCKLILCDTTYADEGFPRNTKPQREVHTYDQYKGWGHGTPLESIKLARIARVKQVIGTHHWHEHKDAHLDAILEHLMQQSHDVAFDFAIEGSRIIVERGSIEIIKP